MSSDPARGAARPMALAAVAILALDQASKYLVVQGMGLAEAGVIDVAPPYLRFLMGWNRGINFGLGASGSDLARWGLVALSVAISAGVAIWVARKPGRWLGVGAGLLIGGALGNAIDRVRFGAVADFLNMSCCGIDNPYTFNVADIAIFAGAAGLALFSGERRA